MFRPNWTSALERHARLQLNDGRELTMGFANDTGGQARLPPLSSRPVHGNKFRFHSLHRHRKTSGSRWQQVLSIFRLETLTFERAHPRTSNRRAIKAEFPKLTFDAVIKVEHLLAQQANWLNLPNAGCAW